MNQASHARKGFALPAVLGVVAILSLVLLAAAAALSAMTQGARRALQAADFERAAMDAEARALVLLSTTPFAADGLRLGELTDVTAPGPRPAMRLDGRSYLLPSIAPLTVSLQDEAGLVNLDASRPDALLRLLARLRLTQGEAETLRDRLLDALDVDGRPRPRGMEAEEYRARGLQPPPPGGFRDLSDVAAVPGWEALAAGSRRRDLAQLATADPVSKAFNVNTASAEVMEVVLGLAPAEAARLRALREVGGIRSLAQAGLPPGAPGEGVRPNGRVRLAVADTRTGLRYDSRLAPSDAAEGPPWIASARLVTREAGANRHDAAPPPDATDPPAAR